jgi:hypothetical protein
MAATPSTMLPLGTPVPAFRLPDPLGAMVSVDDFAAAPALLVMFICNHCPFVKHIRRELAGYTFPYLFDKTQQVAMAFRAACTPEFYLFDGARRLVYRGQMDDSRPGNGAPVTGRDLREAVDALLDGRPIPPDQRPSVGCSIKWRPGNEPDYL